MKKFHIFCTCTTLAAFSLPAAQPRCYGVYDLESSVDQFAADLFDDTQLSLRVDQLLADLNTLGQNDQIAEMIDLMLGFKQEVESTAGISVSLDDAIDQLQLNLQQLHYEFMLDQLEAYKELLDQRLNIKQTNPTTPPAPDGNDITVNIPQGGATGPNTQVIIPTQVALGVTIALCGAIVYVLPIPSSKTLGSKLTSTGINIAISGGLSSKNLGV